MNFEESCKTCENYKKDSCESCGGICLLSKKSNGIMEADDDISANSPFLSVAENFYCNQYKEK